MWSDYSRWYDDANEYVCELLMCISCTYWYVSLYAKGLLKWSQVFVFGRWWYHTQKNNVWYTLLLCHVKLTMSKYTHLMEMYGKVNYVCQMCATQRYGNENRSRSESICVYRTQLKPFGLDKAGKLVRRKVFFLFTIGHKFRWIFVWSMVISLGTLECHQIH